MQDQERLTQAFTGKGTKIRRYRKESFMRHYENGQYFEEFSGLRE